MASAICGALLEMFCLMFCGQFISFIAEKLSKLHSFIQLAFNVYWLAWMFFLILNWHAIFVMLWLCISVIQRVQKA